MIGEYRLDDEENDKRFSKCRSIFSLDRQTAAAAVACKAALIRIVNAKVTNHLLGQQLGLFVSCCDSMLCFTVCSPIQ